MKVEKLALEGLKLVEGRLFWDERGYFTERFNKKIFAENGLPTEFVQDNHSYSKPKVIRGMHYQHSPAQGKLVSVIRGKIWDVVVDLRKDSPTYQQNYFVELSAEAGNALWVPGGFAHGFLNISDEYADVVYKVDCHYAKEKEGGILWDDPALNIPWPLKDPLVSDRDRELSSFEDYDKNPVFSL